MNITKSFIIKEILYNSKNEKDTSFPLEDLRKVFGFIRVDGGRFAFEKLSNSSLTESDMSFCSPSQLKNNIRQFCEEEGFSCNFLVGDRVCLFRKFTRYI